MSQQMNLTKAERLILINQFEILGRLDEREAQRSEFLTRILRDGYTLFYSELFEAIDDEMPDEEGRFVLDLLDMYRALGRLIAARPKCAAAKHPWSIFRGFDGNGETRERAFARFAIEDKGLFEEQQANRDSTDDFNSHCPTRWKYEAMLKAWEQLPIDKRFDLNEDLALAVVSSNDQA